MSIVHKPARKQGRNIQLDGFALAHTRACAFSDILTLNNEQSTLDQIAGFVGIDAR